MKRIYKVFLWLAVMCSPCSIFSQTFTLLKDIVSGSGGSNPTELTNVNGVLFFVATTASEGPELWKTDGTPAGTKMVKDIYPGTRGSNPEFLTNVNGTLFFSADDGVFGKELWKSDGTAAGTILVKDGVPGCCYADGDNFSNHLLELTDVNGTLFFSGVDHEHGSELWVSNGTEAGTIVINIYDDAGGVNSSNVANLTNVNGTLFFSAQTADGYELWKSNGTIAGTVQVKDIVPGNGTNTLSQFTNVNGVLFFTVDDGQHGIELWKSDGTDAGTIMVKDILPGAGSSEPIRLTNVDGTLYFEATDAPNDRELWKSNGTEAGTVLVKDILPGSGSSHPQWLTNVNGTLYLDALDFSGFELWKSNGTNATTSIVKNISPGSASSDPGDLTMVGPLLLFSANDGIHGREIWRSNGTDGGTAMVQNIEPDVAAGGNGSSANPDIFNPHPLNITEVNNKIFITTTTTAYGSEIWVADNAAIVVLPLSLQEFKGRLTQNNALLEWKTSDETNTSSFVIERSIYGRTYIPVGTVAASGNTSGLRNYQFTDPNITSLGAPVIYYRIQQKDVDGHLAFSRIISIPVNSKYSLAQLYPNPVRNEFNLMISVSQDENMQWQILDNTGRILRHQSQPLPAGSISLGINVKGLATGIYYLRIQSNSIQKQISFVKE